MLLDGAGRASDVPCVGRVPDVKSPGYIEWRTRDDDVPLTRRARRARGADKSPASSDVSERARANSASTAATPLAAPAVPLPRPAPWARAGVSAPGLADIVREEEARAVGLRSEFPCE